MPEKWLEFWEEVKDEYPKIISFRAPSELLCTVGNCKYTLDEMLRNNFKIHQVATSPDTIFTIGDRVIDGNNKDQGSFEILGFEYEPSPYDKEKHTRRIAVLHDHKILGKWLDLTKLEKASEPLFVTEDGKEIFEGDTSYGVRLSDFTIKPMVYKDLTYYFPPAIKEFSTREAAERYIEDNKPRFSKKQVEEALGQSKHYNFPCGKYLHTPTFKQKLGI